MGGYFSQAERRSTFRDPADRVVAAMSGGTKSSTGVRVSESSSLSTTAIWQGVRLISESVASVTHGVYERLERGRESRDDHPTSAVLRDPNPEQTGFEFFEMLQGHLPLFGNAYAEKVYNNAGRVVELWPLVPWRVTPKRNPDGSLYYEIAVPGGSDPKRLPVDNVLHMRGFSSTGLLGDNIVERFKESIGLAIGLQEYAGRFFGNNATPSGVITHPQKVSDVARKNMRESWNNIHKGLDGAHRVAILEEGVQFTAIGTDPEKSQLLGLRQFSVTEAARILNVTPHMLHDLERATFNNIYELGVGFVTYTLRPWFVRWERRLARELLLPSERRDLFVRFDDRALLRGSPEAKAQLYQSGLSSGWLSINDVRELEDMNPVPDGDRHFVRRDSIPLDSVDDLVDALGAPEPARSAEPEPEVRAVPESREVREQRSVDSRIRLRRAHEGLFRQVADAVVKREVDGIRSALKKARRSAEHDMEAAISHRRPLTDAERLQARAVAATQLRALIDDFYATHDEWVAERFLTSLLTYAQNVAAEAAREADADVPGDVDEFVGEYADVLGRRWTGSSANQLRKLIEEADPAEVEAVVEGRLSEWEQKRAEKEASREAVEAGEAVTAFVWAAAGVTVLKWRATGENCPLCGKLNGRTVGVKEYFVREGDTVDPEDGQTAPLTSKINVRHPPLHRGCDCAIVTGG